MKYFEFGKETDPLAVILHGGGTSYRGAEPTAKLLGERFHVILAAYDGFNPTEPNTCFKSVMDEAGRLGDYVVDRYGGRIDVLYGISFGCRVLMQVLKDERLHITTTIADGMSLRDYPVIKSKLGKDVYCFFFTGLFYTVMAHPGPLRKRFLAKVTGRSLSEPLLKTLAADLEKLEKPGLLADREKDGLFPVRENPYVPVVRDQGDGG